MITISMAALMMPVRIQRDRQNKAESRSVRTTGRPFRGSFLQRVRESCRKQKNRSREEKKADAT